MTTTSHHTIRESLLERIQSGEWELGGLIPAETQLAEEYGCARTTVNRALRTLAEQGLVIRKRKGGTRIKRNPVRQARFNIPIVREQVEETGEDYSFILLKKKRHLPMATIAERLGLSNSEDALYMETLHMASDKPFALEIRWLNIASIKGLDSAPLNDISINEWLVKSVPFSSGDVRFSAIRADFEIAKALKTETGEALFLIDRTTWLGDNVITTTKTYYPPSFKLSSQL